MKELLLEAEREIQRLRRENEILTAQVQVVEVFATALGMKPQPMGMCEDVAWKLRREAGNLSSDPVRDQLVELAKRWPGHDGVNWDTTKVEDIILLISDAVRGEDLAKQPADTADVTA